jgi:hypothetical protein
MPKMLVNLDMTNNKVINVALPTNDLDAANKQYVDSVAQGLDVKDSVRCASAEGENTVLSGTTNPVDGVTVVAGDRVLVKNNTTGTENGVYIVAAGVWARSLDYAAGVHAAGTFLFVEEGTTQADSGWVCTNDNTADQVNANALIYSQFSGAGTFLAGDGLQKVGNTISVLLPGSSALTAAPAGLSVNVDGTSIEVDSNNLRVAPQGIDQTKIASGAITSGNNGLDASVAGAGLSLAGGALDVNVGTGLVIDGGDSVALDTSNGYGVRKYTNTITGDGSTTSFPLTHFLGTNVLQVTLLEAATGEIVYADVALSGGDTITVSFGAAPAMSVGYTVIAVG